jgi:addiction module HigA family antidote
LLEFLRSLGITQVNLAKAIDVPLQRVNEIIKSKRGFTPDTELRLEAALGARAPFWLNAQIAWGSLAPTAFARGRAAQEDQAGERRLRRPFRSPKGAV